jgi:hypothetical protein
LREQHFLTFSAFVVRLTLMMTGWAEQLDLTLNSFSGTIHESIGNLQSLQLIGFGFNLLTGSLPRSLLQLSSLIAIEVYRNQLTGTLPFRNGSNPNMTYFWADENNLTGSLEPLTYLPK